MRTIATQGEAEVAILARVLGNGKGRLSRPVARHILDVGFSEDDKARMHELAVRNQEDALTPPEKEELLAFAKAGTLLSILKSRARKELKVKPRKRNAT
jgi:hypothetical protein